jgi:hypothetical protein
MTGLAKSRRSPLIAFLRFQRTVPLRATLSTCRVCFAPATLLSFRLQGFEPPEEETTFPQPFLPCRFTRTRTGLTTSEVWTLREAGPNRRSDPIPCLLDVLPSGALPPAAAALGFPSASSHVLGLTSPTTVTEAPTAKALRAPAPQSLVAQRARLPPPRARKRDSQVPAPLGSAAGPAAFRRTQH